MNNYKEYLKSRGKSLVYSNYVKYFLEFLEKKGIGFPAVTKDHITEFFNGKYSSASKNLFINALRNYGDYLEIPKDQNIFYQTKLLKIETHLPSYVTFEDVGAGISYMITNRYPCPDKLRTILWSFFWFALRKNEWLHLSREDIDLKKCTAIIRNTKTKHDRVITFPKDLAKMLHDYFQTEEQVGKNFCNITEAQLRTLLKNTGQTKKQRASSRVLKWR